MSHAVTHDLCYSVNLDSQLVKTPLNGIFATDDCCAHRFNFPLYKGNAQVKPSAGTTVMGYFTRYKGNTTILFEGELTENTASVELPKACYTQGGRFALVVKLMEDGVISTIFCGEGTVIKSSTDNYADPDDIIPSLDDLLAQIAAMKAATTEAKNATEEVRTVLDDEGGAQVAAIREEGAAQIAAAKTEGAAQILAIEEKGERTRQSIPEDWTTLDADVKSLKNTKAPAIEVEASGAIITIDDAAALPVHGLVSQIVPVQSGSGDPSPENVRPISEWDSVKAQRTRKNLYGGLHMAEDIAEKVPSAVIDTDAKTVTFTAPAISGKILFDRFKPNTRYTIVLTSSELSSANRPNVAIHYTEGNPDVLEFNESANGTKRQRAWHSGEGRTIKYIAGYNNSGRQYLLYEECGIFEGVLTAEDFEEYQGQTLTAALPQTVYGGTLDWKTGVLTSDWLCVDLGGYDWFYTENGLFWANVISGGKFPLGNMVCSAYKVTDHTYPTGISDREVWSRYYAFGAQNVIIRDRNYENAAEFKTSLAGVMLAYKTGKPTTYQLTPQQLDMLKGMNNVWSDCGDTSLVYVADTKMYIDKKFDALAAALIG